MLSHTSSKLYTRHPVGDQTCHQNKERRGIIRMHDGVTNEGRLTIRVNGAVAVDSGSSSETFGGSSVSYGYDLWSQSEGWGPQSVSPFYPYPGLPQVPWQDQNSSVRTITTTTYTVVVPANEYKGFLESDEIGERVVEISDLSTNSHRKVKKTVLAHRAVERIASVYGVSVRGHSWEDIGNGRTVLVMRVGGFGSYPETTTIVEFSSSTSHEDAWNLAFDRAVLKHLRIDAVSEFEKVDDAGEVG